MLSTSMWRLVNGLGEERTCKFGRKIQGLKRVLTGLKYKQDEENSMLFRQMHDELSGLFEQEEIY